MAVLLTKKSLARRVYATVLNAGTNTDGCKEQGGHRGQREHGSQEMGRWNAQGFIPPLPHLPQV